MAKKPATKVESAPAPALTGNLGPITDAPINPAMDPSLSAEERLDALRKQHEEMQARAERGESPD